MEIGKGIDPLLKIMYEFSGWLDDRCEEVNEGEPIDGMHLGQRVAFNSAKKKLHELIESAYNNIKSAQL